MTDAEALAEWKRERIARDDEGNRIIRAVDALVTEACGRRQLPRLLRLSLTSAIEARVRQGLTPMTPDHRKIIDKFAKLP